MSTAQPQPKNFFLTPRSWSRTDRGPQSEARKVRIFEDNERIRLEFSPAFTGPFKNQRVDAELVEGSLHLQGDFEHYIVSGLFKSANKRSLECRFKNGVIGPKGEIWDAEEDDDG